MITLSQYISISISIYNSQPLHSSPLQPISIDINIKTPSTLPFPIRSSPATLEALNGTICMQAGGYFKVGW